MCRSLAATIVLAAILIAHPIGAQEPTLDDLLAHAAKYVVHYVDVVSLLVIEEYYSQDLSGRRTMVLPPRGGAMVVATGGQQRELRSDVSLVKVGPPLEWRMYRDVYEVDYKLVRDRTDRLAKLILEPAASAHDQAERIAEESARFNISNVGRTLNEPGLPLVFLQAALQPRFQFTLSGRDRGAGKNVWVVKYEERARPTVFRHNYTVDNPTSGRFSVDAMTGEVLTCEMKVSPPALSATFTTEFRHENRFGVAVPIEMREDVRDGVNVNARRLEGIAKYKNFRQFDVTTGERIRRPIE